MKKCRTCGKKFDVLWPELWRYKKLPGTWYCSWSCLRKDEKGEKDMARPRKNTTPAEEKKEERPVVVELVYDESIKEEYRREQEAKKKGDRVIEIMPLEVAAVFSRVIENHTYKKIDGGMVLTGLTTTLMMEEEDWVRFAGEITQALSQLKG